jgi:hypothetical protein
MSRYFDSKKDNLWNPCGYRSINTTDYFLGFCLEDEWKDKDLDVLYKELGNSVSFDLFKC